MGIDTNTLTLGSSMPAKTAFVAHADDSGVIAAAPDPASGTATGGNDPSGSTDAGTAAGPKSAVASAQTRNAPAARTRGNAVATRARGNAANSAASPTATAPADAAADSGNDFGSLMASALGRSAASNEASIPATAGTGAATTAAPPAQPVQPAAGTAADAVAWIAQAFMAPVAGAQAVANTAGTANPPDPSDTAAGATAAGSDAQTVRALTAQFATQNALTAGQSPGSAAAAPVGAASGSQTPATPTAALPAALTAPAGNLNAVADVQKLIAGLAGASPNDDDPDTAADTAAPKTHAANDSDGADAGQVAAALQGSALIRADSSVGTATLTIHAPVGSAAFADEVGAKTAGLAQSGITQAQLQLNPADLGPVQVHITMQAGQASVWFGATHADTRAALEQSLPRLREMFAGAGMPLTDSGVFREPPQQQQAQSLPASAGSRTTLGDTAVAPTVTQVATIRLALLDTYA